MAKRLHAVEQNFLNTVKENNLINENDIIVVGVSGGPDSTALLSCLNNYKEKFNCKIIVAHINHLIREDSTEDEKYVENLCEKMNIKCYIKRADVEKMASEQKRSTEDMGRIVRYQFFDEIAQKENANKIAIAHNMNDNAETLLLNLIRGAGLVGLEGIRPLEYGKYIRPLINCKRNEIEDYCKINNLEPRIDSTNKENIYKRNIIRNKLIPYIEELNPNIIQTLNRTSKIIIDNNDYINEETLKEYNKIAICESNKVSFDLKKFSKISNNIKTNLIFKAIEQLKGNTKNVEKSNIDDIIRMCNRNVGNKHIMINKEIEAEIKNSKLTIKKNY